MERSGWETFLEKCKDMWNIWKYLEKIGIVLDYNKKLKKKPENKGNISNFVGNSPNHAGGIFRMYNLRTERISITRDVKWLQDGTWSQEIRKSVKNKSEIQLYNYVRSWR